MTYWWLANLVAIFHGFVVLVIILGFFASIFGWFSKRPTWQKTYLIVAGATALSFVIWRACFLTNLEKWLRLQAYPAVSYQGGYISHYLSYVGIQIPDKAVFGTLIVIIATGLFAQILYYFNRAYR